MKQIVKNFNNLIKGTIFKLQNKTNNNFKISNFNKYLITFISLLFFYIFYLLMPLLYDKTWVQTNIENKLLSEFKINLSTSAQISYRILPAPHFLVKDSKIIVEGAKDEKSIAEIKFLKIFLDQRNFFNKEKMNLKSIIINQANFSLLRSELGLLNNIRKKKFSNKKIKVNDSNIFLKNNLDEIISIIKIDKATLFFDDKKPSNIFYLSGEIFNVPFTLDFKNHNNLTKYEEINLSFQSLKLDITNVLNLNENNTITGKNIISTFNSKINTKYDVKEKLIIFKSNNSKINNSHLDYNGKLSINPFDLDLNIRLNNYKISKLLNKNSILTELVKTELLFNDNISINTSMFINSNAKKEIFQSAKINFHIINGKVNFDNTKFLNDKIGLLKLINSNLFLQNGKLVFNSDILINIDNSDHLFSFLNTDKWIRKDLKNILINLDYDFLTNQIKFNNIKIDNNENNEQLLRIIEGFSDNNNNNFNKSRRLVNELLKAIYEG
jgi:hypothetical protein